MVSLALQAGIIRDLSLVLFAYTIVNCPGRLRLSDAVSKPWRSFEAAMRPSTISGGAWYLNGTKGGSQHQNISS